MPAVNMKHEAHDVRIDRKTKWGNPFVMGRDGDRDTVCEKYRHWLHNEIRAGRVTLEDLAALKGKRLGCHCAPGVATATRCRPRRTGPHGKSRPYHTKTEQHPPIIT